MTASAEQFICEPLTPVPGTGDAVAMAAGAPGLPARFAWRGTDYHVHGVVKTWKTTGGCRHGSGEVYLRRHWYTVVTDPPAEMTLYCDRQARDRRHPKARWWVYTVTEAPPHQ
ncbi:MAG: DUF6504 family protein [Planctomycetota bacterium]